MNLTIDTTIPDTWKRIRVQYVSLACGLALAVGALAAFAGWPEGRGGDARVTAPTLSAASRVAPQPETVFYIVDSHEEAATLEAALTGTGLENHGSYTDRRVIVASEQPSLDVLFAEQANGILQNVQVVDLRES